MAGTGVTTMDVCAEREDREREEKSWMREEECPWSQAGRLRGVTRGWVMMSNCVERCRIGGTGTAKRGSAKHSCDHCLRSNRSSLLTFFFAVDFFLPPATSYMTTYGWSTVAGECVCKEHHQPDLTSGSIASHYS